MEVARSRGKQTIGTGRAKNNCIDVEWSQEINETYPVQIRVRAHDRVGLLADIAESISRNGANILNANTLKNHSKWDDENRIGKRRKKRLQAQSNQ